MLLRRRLSRQIRQIRLRLRRLLLLMNLLYLMLSLLLLNQNFRRLLQLLHHRRLRLRLGPRFLHYFLVMDLLVEYFHFLLHGLGVNHLRQNLLDDLLVHHQRLLYHLQ